MNFSLPQVAGSRRYCAGTVFALDSLSFSRCRHESAKYLAGASSTPPPTVSSTSPRGSEPPNLAPKSLHSSGTLHIGLDEEAASRPPQRFVLPAPPDVATSVDGSSPPPRSTPISSSSKLFSVMKADSGRPFSIGCGCDGVWGLPARHDGVVDAVLRRLGHGNKGWGRVISR